MKGGFLVSWTSGHIPPRWIYLREHAEGWGATEDRSAAAVFSSIEQAQDAWLKKHRFPEDYRHCLASGQVRAEAVNQPRLPLHGEIR